MTAAEAGTSPPRRGIGFWLAVAVGWSMIGFGIRGALHEGSATHPPDLARWMAMLLLAHDLVLAPAAFVVAAIAGRLVTRSAGVVRAAVALSALVVLISWPLVRGYGRRASNPTALPLDYTANLVGVLVVIWVFTGVVVVTRAWWRRPRRHQARR